MPKRIFLVANDGNGIIICVHLFFRESFQHFKFFKFSKLPTGMEYGCVPGIDGKVQVHAQTNLLFL